MMKSVNTKFKNSLIHESSAYLLSHSGNPVSWFPWNQETLAKAKSENKPMIISIGYSACHWCHVMERESFMDEEVAEIMNKYYISVKIDREERPDLDSVYMEAVQQINGSGGWPLNCFAMPDGKPFWGGTYFTKQQWIETLIKIKELYAQRFDYLYNLAQDLSKQLNSSLHQWLQSYSAGSSITHEKAFDLLSGKFDVHNGGELGAPKFPIPIMLNYLINHFYYYRNQTALSHVLLTLDKIAQGGIYDHVGGGFFRYATDNLWRVPHFEKMLYDNAQLLSLYSKVSLLVPDNRYELVIQKTLGFLLEEFLHPQMPAFYASMDADSEGVEGKYYVWEAMELKDLLGEYYHGFASTFAVIDTGNWEHGQNILYYSQNNQFSDNEASQTAKSNADEMEKALAMLKEKRKNREAPFKDTKIIVSWNALLVLGLIDVYKYNHDKNLIPLMEKILSFIISQSIDGQLPHIIDPQKQFKNGFLEDYAFMIEALIEVYPLTGKENYLILARKYMETLLKYYYNKEFSMFNLSENITVEGIQNKPDLYDNVIPSSNSSLMRSLLKLGYLFSEPSYFQIAEKALQQVQHLTAQYPSAFSNWMTLDMEIKHNLFFAIVPKKLFNQAFEQLHASFMPNVYLLSSNEETQIPIIKNKPEISQNIYLCDKDTCYAPVKTLYQLFAQIDGFSK